MPNVIITLILSFQELVIQQLEDVITHRAAGGDGISQATSGGDQELVGVYKARLKMAVKDLIKIAQKNKLLTEINNRLLAEMSKNGQVSCTVIVS